MCTAAFNFYGTISHSYKHYTGVQYITNVHRSNHGASQMTPATDTMEMRKIVIN